MKNFLSKRNKFCVILLLVCTITGGSIFYFINHPPTYFVKHPRLTAIPAEVKGSIITLRTLGEKDFIDYHNMFSLTVRRNLEYPEEITLDYTIRQLKYELEAHRKRKMLLYGIFDNAENKLIGSIEIREKNDRDPGQLGCWLNENYWGNGRIQEALKLITQTYFALTQAPDYIAHVRLWNKRSYRALTKFGLQEIGSFYEKGEPTRFLLQMKRPW